MLALIVSLVGLLLQGSNTTTFYVEKVEVLSSYHAQFVLRLANAIVPPDRLVQDSDITCLVNEVKASGLFSDVKATLVSSSNKSRRLTLSCVHKADTEKAVINEISLVELPEIDKAKFQRSLREKGIQPGIRLLKYPYQVINSKIDIALRESLPQGLQNAYTGSAWISIKANAVKGFSLINTFAKKLFEN